MRNIFLIGFMGVGKSTIAYHLQSILNADVVEMDHFIAKQQKMSIAEIFEKFGESYFRDLESNLLLDIRKKQGLIVSCGGGIVIREENIGYMKQSGVIVLLSALPETIYERVKDSKERPILNGNMNIAYIAKLQQKRRALYEAAADITIATDQKDIRTICEEIIATIQKELH